MKEKEEKESKKKNTVERQREGGREIERKIMKVDKIIRETLKR